MKNETTDTSPQKQNIKFSVKEKHLCLLRETNKKEYTGTHISPPPSPLLYIRIKLPSNISYSLSLQQRKGIFH